MTEYWVEFPVLNGRSLLVIFIRYSSVYVSLSPHTHQDLMGM